MRTYRLSEHLLSSCWLTHLLVGCALKMICIAHAWVVWINCLLRRRGQTEQWGGGQKGEKGAEGGGRGTGGAEKEQEKRKGDGDFWVGGG